MVTITRWQSILAVIGYGVLFSIVFAVAIRCACYAYGVVLSAENERSLHAITGGLTGVLSAFLYNRMQKSTA